MMSTVMSPKDSDDVNRDVNLGSADVTESENDVNRDVTLAASETVRASSGIGPRPSLARAVFGRF